MTTETSPLIVSEGHCDCATVHRLNVHHRDFPELRAEGETSAIAAAYLAEKFEGLLEGPLEPRQRDAVELAIEDVRSFIHTHGLAT